VRIAVVGATGNVGSSLVEQLSEDDRVTSIVGIARRAPAVQLPKVEWRAADVRRDDLAALFDGADAVVSLAWLLRPFHRPDVLASVNVGGTRRVIDAAAQAGVPSIVYASSIGTYSRKQDDVPVDESWPTGGIPSCPYSRDKAAVERMLDRFESEHPGTRVVRIRPGLVFKRGAAAEITRYFIGWQSVGRHLPARLPIAPVPTGLVTQCVHSHDLAAAFTAAIFSDVSGAFNVATDPVIDARLIGQHYGVRTVSIPPAAVRAAMSAAWHARLQPVDPSWLDMAMQTPTMDCSRARDVLGWRPEHSSTDAMSELYGGIRRQTGQPTPPLRA
jgi:nucleoside-diphosphate-sugar epimerase